VVVVYKEIMGLIPKISSIWEEQCIVHGVYLTQVPYNKHIKFKTQQENVLFTFEFYLGKLLLLIALFWKLAVVEEILEQRDSS